MHGRTNRRTEQPAGRGQRSRETDRRTAERTGERRGNPRQTARVATHLGRYANTFTSDIPVHPLEVYMTQTLNSEQYDCALRGRLHTL